MAIGVTGGVVVSRDLRRVGVFTVVSCTDDLAVASDGVFYAYFTRSFPTGWDGAITIVVEASRFRPDAYVRKTPIDMLGDI